jgi:adenylosuccinate synthase
MMVNQALERRRGDDKHGSCGMGIWETELRNQVCSLRVSDLFGPRHLWREKLYGIREVYVKDRMHELDLTMKDMPLLMDEGLFEHFAADVETLTKNVTPKEWHHLFVDQFERIVYEGAQGLRLDRDIPSPHVSGSKTGLPNVLALQQEVGFPEVMHVYYVTRPYITRHGAGPLFHECWPPPFSKIKDETNTHNKWQGVLRFAWMDVDELMIPIHADLDVADNFDDCALFPHLAITCCDHVGDPDHFHWFDSASPRMAPLTVFVGEARSMIFPHIHMLMSHGPKREDVARLESLGG